MAGKISTPREIPEYNAAKWAARDAELAPKPVTPPTLGQAGQTFEIGNAIGLTKSAMGDCADEIVHPEIRKKLDEIVEMLYGIRQRQDARIEALEAQLDVARLKAERMDELDDWSDADELLRALGSKVEP